MLGRPGFRTNSSAPAAPLSPPLSNFFGSAELSSEVFLAKRHGASPRAISRHTQPNKFARSALLGRLADIQKAAAVLSSRPPSTFSTHSGGSKDQTPTLSARTRLRGAILNEEWQRTKLAYHPVRNLPRQPFLE